jgi:coenzyme F420 hydrogenase subunit beta
MDSVLNRVVETGLCVRCGACISICPFGVLVSGKSLFPEAALPEKCTSCEACIRVCPGHSVDFPALSREIFEREFDFRNVIGSVRNIYAASATDQGIREDGSSGGLITALLVHHLETGLIDGALVVTAEKSLPTVPRSIIATTREEILRSAQSKYCIVDPLVEIGPVQKLPPRVAVVGLPCHVHGVRKWMALDRRLREKVKLIIGLVCNTTLEREASTALLGRKKIPAGDVAKDGKMVKLHEGNIKDGAFNFLKYIYYPPRCLACIDFSNDFADLSVADPWIRSPDGGFMFPDNVSTVIVRTERGEQALAQAQAGGAITREELSQELLSRQFRGGYRAKRSGASVRIDKIARSGKQAPDYVMTLPGATWSERIAELREMILRLPGKNANLQKTAMFLAFSPIGRFFTRLKSRKNGANKNGDLQGRGRGATPRT